MATTAPFALLDGQPLSIQMIYDEYTRALGDSDKTMEVENANYYQGQVDALVLVLSTLHALRQSTCVGCGKILLATTNGVWLDEDDCANCDPQPGWAKIPHLPMKETS